MNQGSFRANKVDTLSEDLVLTSDDEEVEEEEEEEKESKPVKKEDTGGAGDDDDPWSLDRLIGRPEDNKKQEKSAEVILREQTVSPLLSPIADFPPLLYKQLQPSLKCTLNIATLSSPQRSELLQPAPTCQLDPLPPVKNNDVDRVKKSAKQRRSSEESSVQSKASSSSYTPTSKSKEIAQSQKQSSKNVKSETGSGEAETSSSCTIVNKTKKPPVTTSTDNGKPKEAKKESISTAHE